MKHLTAQEILELHDLIIERYGGCSGCPDPQKIEALVGRVINFELYAGVNDAFALAAMYWVAVARGHVFTDGNKRTAVLVAFTFLRRCGIRPFMRPELEGIAVQVASGEMSCEDLTSCLADFFGN